MRTETRIEEIKQSIAEKSTEYLLAIWNADKRDEYSDEGFEAIRQVLEERGHSFPPKQPIETPEESPEHRQLRRKKAVGRGLGGLLLLAGVLGNVIFRDNLQKGWTADPTTFDLGAIFAGLIIIGICLLVLARRIKLPPE